MCVADAYKVAAAGNVVAEVICVGCNAMENSCAHGDTVECAVGSSGSSGGRVEGACFKRVYCQWAKTVIASSVAVA